MTSTPLLERFGLHRPQLRAWAMYDWANSAFYLVIIATVFPIFFQHDAASQLPQEKATFYFGLFTTVSMAIVALISPILGALADFMAWRKRLMALFVALGVVTTAAMALIQNGQWVFAGILFALSNIGVAASFVFYDAFLPHIATSDEMDRVSTAGYALGYLGSGLLLIVNLWWIQKPELFGIPSAGAATRLTFLSVGIWWAVFSLPLFRQVPEPPRVVEADESDVSSAIQVTFRRLFETFHELRGSYRQAFMMLVAMLIYNDGIGTIIRMAAIYAVSRGIPESSVIVALLVVQFVGIPFAFAFGLLAGRIGPKASILLTLATYIGVSVVAFFMETAFEFYVLAFLVGMVQGGAQALSRSLFASMIPKHKAAEFFGFFSVFEKFAGIFGPLVFSAMIAFTGSMRAAILSLIAFFVVGGYLLTLVNVAAGRQEARAAEDRLVGELAAGG